MFSVPNVTTVNEATAPLSQEAAPCSDNVLFESAVQNTQEVEPQPGPSSAPDIIDSEPSLDPEILAALGEFVEDSPEYGGDIHETLTKFWPTILKKGVTKDTKDDLLKKHLIPNNCRLLQAPQLNAEISAAISDMGRNRDKKLMHHQQQLGAGITAINKGMHVLLSSDGKSPEALKHLSDGCRILSDLHFILTQYRMKLITPCLDKAFLNVIQDSQRDETLFGNAVADKIKALKAVEKQGHQIKKGTPNQRDKPSSSTPNRPNQGNWSGPPRYQYQQAKRGGRGGGRPRSAMFRAPTPQYTYPYHHQSYQPYSTQPPPPPPRPANNKPRATHP